MPRTARASAGDYCYHAINRGNARAEVFHADGDYQAFLNLLGQASQRLPMRILAYCLMPNHFHLALWPSHDGDLSRWMQWLLTAQVRRYHTYHDSSGHIWQGRFKVFPIEQDAKPCSGVWSCNRTSGQAYPCVGNECHLYTSCSASCLMRDFIHSSPSRIWPSAA
ncbi:MAG: transposase [Nitrospira sp.]